MPTSRMQQPLQGRDGMESTDFADALDCAGYEFTPVRTRILAYLGELKSGEYVAATSLVYHLGLRFTTAKSILTKLEQEWLVEKKIINNRGIVALFRIMPDAKVPAMSMNQQTNQQSELVPFVPPEWRDAYGKHPSGT